ncbi:MAG: DEAD/DEAH box helicase, partial [Planctomycetota bacterium]
ALVSMSSRRPLTQSEFLRLMQLLNTQRIIANGLAQLDFTSVWPAIRERRPTPRLLRGLFSPKLSELRELVQQLVVEQGRRVVVFSQWRRMLRLSHWVVGDVLAAAGLEARFFTGAERAKRRTQNLVDFHDDDRVRILFASDAGGVGLNLQRAANACIHLDLPWNPAVFEQRVGRIHRLGQTDPIDVYSLIGARSIEERIKRLMADKRELFQGIFDGNSDAVDFESAGTFLEGVGRMVDEAAGPDAAASNGVEPEPEREDEEQADLMETAEPEIDELVTAADEAADVEPAPPASNAAEVQGLFARITVERTEEGGLRIEAPPEAAASLAALFEGMASLMAKAGRP